MDTISETNLIKLLVNTWEVKSVTYEGKPVIFDKESESILTEDNELVCHVYDTQWVDISMIRLVFNLKNGKTIILDTPCKNVSE